MKSREEFVQMACAMNMHAIENESQRKHFAEHLVETAKVVADELALERDRVASLGDAEREILRQELEAAKARIRTLEAELEQATAPKPARRGG